MKANQYDIGWLEDPKVFQANRLDAISDHIRLIDGKPCRQSLNGTWHIHYSDTLEGRDENFYKEEVSYRSKPQVQVPGHLQLQGYGHIQYTNQNYPWDGIEEVEYGNIPHLYNPTANLVRYFNLNADLDGRDVHLVFEGVESAFYVWLNGEFIGYSTDSFSPARFDVTQALKPGLNKLAVQVHQYSCASWLEDQDFFRFFGIFRDVYLEGRAAWRIDDLRLTTTLSNNYQDARIIVDILTNKKGGHFKIRFEDAQGQEVLAFETDQTYLAMDVKNIRLWSAEDPYLYTLIIEVLSDTKELCETVIQKVGLREFKMEEGIMKINGRRIVFKGINRHEFSAKTGRTLSREEMEWDVKFLKQNNVNAVRTSHYPNQSYWYELADTYGLYLIDEVNLETHGTWQSGELIDTSNPLPASSRDWRGMVLDRANSLYQRDKNHPSVLIWSLGNESSVGDTLLEEAEFFRRSDPFRLVHYEGCWNEPHYSRCTDMYSRMYATAKETEAYVKSKPIKPMILCEYSHAMGNSLGGLEEYTALEAYPSYQGGFIWDYIDQALEIQDENGTWLGYGGDFGDQPNDSNFSGNGILFADRTPSPKAAAMKASYQNLKIEVAGHGVKITNDNLFTHSKEYEFRYTLTKEGRILQQGILNTDVPAGKVKKYYIPWDKEEGEVVKTVSAHLKQDTLWAPKGYEVAFGQSVSGQYEHIKASSDPLRIETGKGYTGFYADGFRALFGPKGLVSLQYDNKEYIRKVPAPVFAHAWTDNEEGYHHPFESAMWYSASQFARVRKLSQQIDGQNRAGVISYEYRLPVWPAAVCTVTYTIASPGLIGVDVSLEGSGRLPDLPLFGMQFPLVKGLDTFRYYGLGPQENYRDRKQGSKLSVYTLPVASNLTPYLRPQESGNRTDVRWMDVVDANRQGLRFSMVNTPLEMNVQNYSFSQIQEADHPHELAKSKGEYVTVMKGHMGVGGDDSWGAPVLEKYRLYAKERESFAFIISKA